MSCYSVLRQLLVGILLGAMVLFPAANAKASRPHIVVYLSDDHSQYDSSLYGAADIPTPNFGSLARDGVMLTHAFVPSPSCVPCRAAILTGRTPARNGAEANHQAPRRDVPVLIQNLQALGYTVASFGKVAHYGMGKRFGFDVIKPAADNPRLKRNVTEYVRSYDASKPLCLFVGISNPHVPWPKKFTVKPEEMQLPPVHLDTPLTREHRARYVQEIIDLDRFLGELRDLTRVHLGENVLFIHTSDHGSQWPFGKWTLYDYGIRVPFLASWPGKIKPSTRTDAMINLVDLVPTLIDAAGCEVPGDLDGRSVLDVLTGKADTGREVIFTTHTGDGRFNIYPSRAVRTPEWKLIHNLHPEWAFTNHSDLLRNDGAGAYWSEWVVLAPRLAKAKAIVDRYYERPEFELYHVSEDKWEEHNLIDDPQHAELVAELKRQLLAWMTAQGDRETVHHAPRPLAEPWTWRPDFFGTRQQELKRN